MTVSSETLPAARTSGRSLRLVVGGLALALLARLGSGWANGLAAYIPERLYALLTILLIGVVASAALQAFFSAGQLRRWAPNGRLLGPLAGGTLGLVFPVCEC